VRVPLLPRGIDIFPDSLFDLPEREFPWWVAHVRSRQEKVLARYLFTRGVSYYLPSREHKIRRAGRTFVSHLPLFPGYVFFRGSADERLTAVRSNLVVSTLTVLDQGLLSEELLQLRRLQEAGASLVTHAPLAPGDAVRIVDGPFEGYTGVVVREASRLRLVIAITMLKKAVAVEFDREALDLVPRRRLAARNDRSVA
jgi:transcription antitermination factor NusG